MIAFLGKIHLGLGSCSHGGMKLRLQLKSRQRRKCRFSGVSIRYGVVWQVASQETVSTVAVIMSATAGNLTHKIDFGETRDVKSLTLVQEAAFKNIDVMRIRRVR